MVDLNRSESELTGTGVNTPPLALNSLCSGKLLHCLQGGADLVGLALVRRGAGNQSADGPSPSPTGFGKTLVGRRSASLLRHRAET